tara:strand:- start:1558 stop:2181 length:624 start_codon:yes stop_codon:yes gene_type:complete
MKISYAITVCNEFIEIQRLLGFLLENKRDQDEIVILYDSKNGSKEVEQVLDHYNSITEYYTLHKSPFNSHFADWKNLLTSLCSGDYIYQIDADEMVSSYVLDSLPEVLSHNNVDVLKVPRINTVEGLTQEHVQKWGWRVDEKGWVNFPDFQWRIYKNNGKIKWKNKVHEILEGYFSVSYLPTDEEWCLKHPKTIKKQEKQNEYYNTL